jgi:hypothetical protein
MADPISIQFNNFCARTSFSQSGSLTGYTINMGVNSFSQLPGDTLLYGGGQQSMVLNSNAISDLLNGTSWISLGWKNDSTDYHFGIKIYVPLQVMGIGDRPYYQIATGYGDSLSWTTPVDDPADPYTLSPVVEIQMQVVPTSYHTGLSVVATIKDPA